MTFNEVYQEWVAEKSLQVKESTMSVYITCLTKKILPKLGEIHVDNFRAKDLQIFINETYINDKLSEKSLKDIAIIVKMILHWAWERYEMPFRPMKIVYPGRSSSEPNKKKLEVYSVTEQKKLSEWVKSNPTQDSYAMLLLLFTGMRIGELCALKFKDVDFENCTINVSRTLERITDFQSGRTKIVEQSAKTPTSVREIPVPKNIITFYKKMRAAFLCTDDFYLTTCSKKWIEPRVFRTRMTNMCKEAGVRRIKPHGFRHTYATSLIRQNVDMKTVSSLLGHSDVSITMNVYVHTSSDQKKEALKSITKGLI